MEITIPGLKTIPLSVMWKAVSATTAATEKTEVSFLLNEHAP